MRAETLRFGGFQRGALPMEREDFNRWFIANAGASEPSGLKTIVRGPEGGNELRFHFPSVLVANGNTAGFGWAAPQMSAGGDYVELLVRLRKPIAAHVLYHAKLYICGLTEQNGNGMVWGYASFVNDVMTVGGGRHTSGASGESNSLPGGVAVAEFEPGDAYWFVRVQMKVGTYNRVRAWRDGDAEPDTWHWTIRAQDVGQVVKYGPTVGLRWNSGMNGDKDDLSQDIYISALGVSFDPNERASTDPSGRILVRGRQLR